MKEIFFLDILPNSIITIAVIVALWAFFSALLGKNRCKKCGHRWRGSSSGSANRNYYSIAGLTCALIGVPVMGNSPSLLDLTFLMRCMLFGIPAIILGAVGRTQSRKLGTGRKSAITALVLGCLHVFLGCFYYFTGPLIAAKLRAANDEQPATFSADTRSVAEKAVGR
ncbi:MAG: hypothetical protein NTY01_01985 [Verrucomicrobia bacterium]|nr:hypothetical protein [Verrucomicrobiota bacterium]